MYIFIVLKKETQRYPQCSDVFYSRFSSAESDNETILQAELFFLNVFSGDYKFHIKVVYAAIELGCFEKLTG